jgi:hypothetical protein
LGFETLSAAGRRTEGSGASTAGDERLGREDLMRRMGNVAEEYSLALVWAPPTMYWEKFWV